MKKILFTLVLLLSGMTTLIASVQTLPTPDADGFITVTTAAELRDVIQEDHAAKVRLGADIDISDIGQICGLFTGTINGEYDKVDPETSETQKASHILKGKNTKEDRYSHKSSRLFDVVGGATFESIIFANLCIHADENEPLGIIAKSATQCHFKNLVFHSNSLFNDDDFVGLIVGAATQCSFENVSVQSCDVTTDASYAGSLVGQSDNCTFNGITLGTYVYVFADGGGINAYSGGITGYSESDTFTHCVNLGLVGGNDNNVGGMAGYSENSDFLSCSNSATVAHCGESTFSDIQANRKEELAKLDETTLKSILSNIGVGVGVTVVTDELLLVALYFVFEAYENYTYISFLLHVNLIYDLPWLLPAVLIGVTACYIYYVATGDDYAGGIVGCALGGTIEHCANFGLINAVDQFVGGIAGDARGVIINNCLNVGDVKHQRDNSFFDGYPRVGSIAGRGMDYNDIRTKITNCLSTVSVHSSCRQENHRLDPASGNNYCVNLPEYDDELDFLEKSVSQDILESGVVAYWLNNGKENLEKGIRPWQQNLGTNAYPNLGDNGVYHARNVSNEYGTVCLPFALKSDDAIRYYTFSESSDANGETKLNFNYAETVAPGTPVLFRVAETGDVTFSDANNGWATSPVAPASADWNFTGTYKEKTFTGEAATKTIYFVSNGAIKHSSTNVDIKPYRAYFEGPNIDELTSNGSGARISIVIDGEEGETSALELVYDYENHNENRSYTLFGTEAGEGYRGIVIRGGKKVIVNN